MMEETRKKELSRSAMESITDRLSLLDNLYFPQSFQNTAINPIQRKSILLDLLSRDTAVFLERYGSQLTPDELSEFDVLQDDYEINWHLNHIRSLINPTTEEVRSRSVSVKNRRRAYLDKLVIEGDYFSEDVMRDREPYLHHEYVGKFQDQSGRSMARPGERWSDTLMRRSEEAILVAKIRGEQQRLGVDEKDWVGNEREEEEDMEEKESEEEEEDDDEMEEGKEEAFKGGDDGNPTEVVPDRELPNGIVSEGRTTLSTAEIEDQLEQFTIIMHQKFLSGEDTQHLDYSKIDNDETLDDHWFREVSHDAEEKYFDED